ncbi:MAG TPA: hypothetical protein P5531_02995 [Bacteroidales bacterium]|nr:hypothetical protein [Bacteroidales bacterium]HSA42514.1 hypothetical protein [Bacteroidales bacterium]
MKKPKFGSGILSDVAKPQLSGKIEAIGIFTQFNAWGYPCKRSCFLTFTVYNLSGQDTIIISLKKKGKKEQTTIGIYDFNEANSEPVNQTIPIPILFSFTSQGDYEILCTFKDNVGKLSIPFIVKTLEWPTFSEEEIRIIDEHRDQLPYKINVNVNCAECSHVYVFEESIFNDEPPSGGTIRFPENGGYECENCGHILELKDIQGRIRASLKENVLKLIKL